MGDFNAASRPPGSFSQPPPWRARRAQDNGARPQQPFWKALFDAMLEIESDLPTRFNKTDYTASAMPRTFISLPSRAAQEFPR